MFYLYFLLFLTLSVALIFFAPLRAKVWVTTAIVSIVAVALAVPSIAALTGAGNFTLTEMVGPIFGNESLSIDSLTAIFLLIIGVAGVATLIYSKGYLQHYLDKNHLRISRFIMLRWPFLLFR